MYSSDSPINNKEEDLLGRAAFAKILAQSIIDSRSSETLCLGIFGKWGSGKSSLINITLQELSVISNKLPNEDKPVIVQFNPWNFSNTDQLLTQFFVKLSNELINSKDKKLLKIGKAIKKYSIAMDVTNLIPYFGGVISSVGKSWLHAMSKKLMNRSISEAGDISEQKEIVTNLLKNQKNKIIIVIDDIDRLSNEHIRLVFQLVNSVARFPNTMYILSFDREIIVNALEQVQDGDGNEYLEKIIQVPIEIPEIQESKIQQVLFHKLDEILKEFPDMSFNLSHWREIFNNCISPFIENLRDINRLCNLVRFKLGAIYSEINFSDIVALSALEIVYPQIYRWIKNNKNILTGDTFSYFHKTGKSQEEWQKYYENIIKKTIHSNNNIEIDTEDQTIVIIKFLSYLFPYFGQTIGQIYITIDQDLFRRNKQVAHSDKFNLYFNLNMDDVILMRDILDQAIFKMSYDELTNFILDIEKRGSTRNFLDELKSALPEIDTTRAMIISEVLFETSEKFLGDDTYFSIPTSQISIYIINKLLNTIDGDERYCFIEKVLENASLECIQVFSVFLNDIELAYGRLAGNGQERNFGKLISIENLENLEQLFCIRVKKYLTFNNILDFKNSKMIIYLLDNFDRDFSNSYFNDNYFNPVNTIKYLSLSVCKWIGNSIEWEVNKDYKKYLSDEKILSAIDITLKEQTFFSLSKDVQNRIASFYLLRNNSQNYNGHVLQSSVDILLSDWMSINK